MTAVPFGVCATSGWNCTANSPRSGSSIEAIGIASVRAVTRNPSGARVTASPWLIHTCSSEREVPEQDPGVGHVELVPPYSRRPVASTSPPSACAMSWCP